MIRHRLLEGLFALALLAPAAVDASPWTLPKGRAVLWTGATYQTAGQEFLDSGGAQVFPLNGRYDATSFQVGGRIGLTDDFEVEFTVPFSVVSYQADPVILLDVPPGQGRAQDFFQENVIDLSQIQSGLSDVRLAGRYRLLRGSVVAAIQVGMKVPMGYDGPAGTFGARPETEAEFRENLATFVAPENVTDDVTLGDGQVDLSASLLLGYALRAGTFFRVNAGYRLRFGGAADQVTALARVGQAIGRRVLVYAGGQLAYAVQDGRLIGVSVAAIDPTLPAAEYGGDTNLLLREVQLARNAVDVGGGLIVRLTDKLEFNASYEYTVWGRNTTAVHAASMSLALRVEIF